MARSPALNGTKENCLIGYKSKTESLRTLIIVQNYCALIGVRFCFPEAAYLRGIKQEETYVRFNH